ncbi:MAG: twin-arginine translocation signal domain-containing protein, partial [Pseudomonadota bacterium]
MKVSRLNRRQFLQLTGVVGGSFMLGTLPRIAVSKGSVVDDRSQLGHFVSLDDNGDLTIVCQRAEMGQGIVTSVPQIIADEMG